MWMQMEKAISVPEEFGAIDAKPPRVSDAPPYMKG